MRSEFAVAFLAAALAAATTVRAQEPRPEPRPKPAPRADSAPQPAPEAKPQKEPPRRPGQLANVRIDVKIVDERGGLPALTKAVSLTVADRRDGFIRSSAEARPGATPGNLQVIPLHVDASPEIEGSHIRLGLSLEYNFVETSRPAETPEERSARERMQYPKLEIRERLGLVLEDGKTLRVTQSADPLSDRRVSLEVTASILR